VWISGHVGADGWWIPGFWRLSRFAGHVWIDGQVVDGVYYHGHWEPLQLRAGWVWVPGYIVGIEWVLGHWRLTHRAGHVWVGSYMEDGVWSPGYWASYSMGLPHVHAKTVVYVHGGSKFSHGKFQILKRKHSKAYAKKKAAYQAKQKAKAVYQAKQKAKAVYQAKQKAKAHGNRVRSEGVRAPAASPGSRRSLRSRSRRTEVKRPVKTHRNVSPTRNGATRGVPRAKDVHGASGVEMPRTRKATSGGRSRGSSKASSDERRSNSKRLLPAHRHGAKKSRGSRSERKGSGERLRISRD
jgi:hypothetical protein